MHSLRKTYRLGGLVICLLLTAAARYELLARPADSETQVKEVLLVPPGQVLRSLDLGYHSLAADLLFIRANLYYGHHLTTDEQLPWLSDFIDILLSLDPDFKKAYLWGALATTYTKRRVDYVPAEIIERAVRILDLGMRRFPDDHRFPMRIAFNHYYELGDVDRALPYFLRSARTPGAPSWLREKLVDLYTKKGKKEIALRTLSELVMDTDDPALSRALRDRVNHLLQEKERDSFLEPRKALVGQWQAEYDFLPLDLYLLIREP